MVVSSAPDAGAVTTADDGGAVSTLEGGEEPLVDVGGFDAEEGGESAGAAVGVEGLATISADGSFCVPPRASTTDDDGKPLSAEGDASSLPPPAQPQRKSSNSRLECIRIAIPGDLSWRR